jgi:hypothetical protein
MSQFATGDSVTASKIGNKTVLIDTGTNIGGATVLAGQLAVSTDTSGGFTQDRLYVRNAANNAWLEVLDLSSAQTLGAHSISGSSNTITNLSTAMLSDGTFAMAKLANALTQVAVFRSSSSFTQSSGGGTQVIATLTITAAGGHALSLTVLTAAMTRNAGSSTGNEGAYICRTASISTPVFFMICAGINSTMTMQAPETAPGAGSYSRSLLIESASDGSVTMNSSAQTNGIIFSLAEIL